LLPQHHTRSVRWSEEAILEVRGTELWTDTRQTAAREHKLMRGVCGDVGSSSKGASEVLTIEAMASDLFPAGTCRHLLWALDTVVTRAVQGPQGDVMLLPLHDMSNHHFDGAVTSLRVGEGHPATIYWESPFAISRGELRNLYGEGLSNMELLCTYGFFLPDNPFSRVLVAPGLQETMEAQYDLDEDFPPYANDQNKELNQIVREKVRLVAQLGLEIEEHQERLKILTEHLKSVKMELVHTQSLVDTKNKEIETEEHMKQITERQSGRLKNEIEKLEQRIADQQDRLNNI